MKPYFRPLSLVFGRDARALIEAGKAGCLGGFANIGFTHVEVIERGIGRMIEPFANLADLPDIHMITAPRPAFGGVNMDQTRIMGIVNVTPDSFSDGGRLSSVDMAVAHGMQMAEDGADILDVGGESTRPGSDTVAVDEELARVLPVVEALAQRHVVSVDTRKSAVMAQTLGVGACIVNDVSSLSYDAESAPLLARLGVPVVLMHAQGEPKTMQLNPRYDDVLLDVYDGLAASIAKAEAAGIARSHICIDPGIGFGKSFRQNLDLLAGIALFHGLGVPLLVGLSRKGFIGAVTGEKLAADRVHGSVGGALLAAQQAAHIVRVHDVKATANSLKVFTASHDPDSADF